MSRILCKQCESVGLFRCGRCRDPTLRYCSQKCQKLHWKEEHKPQCIQVGGSRTQITIQTDHVSWNREDFRTGDEAGRASRGDFRTDAEALAEEAVWADRNSSNEAIMGLLDSVILGKPSCTESK
jgi:hypothetical protein